MKQAQRIMEMVLIDIISDIVMPLQSGFDFIHWVRDNKYTVQVIFLTSYAEFDYARHAIAMSSIDYLLKPIDYDKLAEAVGKAAGKPCGRLPALLYGGDGISASVSDFQ